jgi:exopolyphosphatase/guanosine-5'-triphosphate,3'-diphosphate pyrophosphatase
LSDGDRRLLTVAALLHDIGISVSFQGHHKHSLDMIASSTLPGFSARDMCVAANVARYHRKSEPTLRHSPFAALTPDEQQRVEKMAALLRLADGLDRSHGQLVTRIRATAEKRTLRLELVARGGLPLELCALQKKTPLFTRVFKLNVHATVTQEAP